MPLNPPSPLRAVGLLLLLSLPAASARCSASQSSAPVVSAPATRASGFQALPGLGATSFPTSTHSPEAQTAFMRGLLLLHLFEYAEAADNFIAAQKLDPTFALAFWGEAMTYNHGVWNQLEAPAGIAALAKFAPSPAARAARIADPRERAYMAAVDLLFDGTGTKPERDRRYAEAMRRLSASFPDDRNAQLFYALALLGQSEGVRDVPVYLQAATISQTVFHLEPENPGAAHYWIHGMDDPAHAAGALPAARALSLIAPDAGHAQHMCSHIFIALGMWDDVVKANLDAIRVDDLRDKAAGFPVYSCNHYPSWLVYGYIQQGRLRDARRVVAACHQTDLDTTAWIDAHPGQVPFRARSAARLHQRLRDSFAFMRSIVVIDTNDWTAAEEPTLDTSSLTADAAPWASFTSGFAAAERNDLPAARAALATMHTEADGLRSGHDADPEDLQALAIADNELSGLIAFKDGHVEAGLAAMRRAADTYHGMPFAFGPPVTIKPPDELLGEALLQTGSPTAAREAFEQALQRAPERTASLLGRARAEQLAGDRAGARAHFVQLLSIWHDADPDTPGLHEARALLSPREH